MKSGRRSYAMPSSSIRIGHSVAGLSLTSPAKAVGSNPLYCFGYKEEIVIEVPATGAFFSA